MSNYVLVTGGAGYIGSHSVLALMEAGYKPIVLDNFSNSSKESISGIEKINGGSPVVIEGKSGGGLSPAPHTPSMRQFSAPREPWKQTMA